LSGPVNDKSFHDLRTCLTGAKNSDTPSSKQPAGSYQSSSNEPHLKGASDDLPLFVAGDVAVGGRTDHQRVIAATGDMQNLNLDLIHALTTAELVMAAPR
jgi:hypothetical protein